MKTAANNFTEMLKKYYHFAKKVHSKAEIFKVVNKKFEIDSYTNVSPKILSLLNKNLYNKKFHPLCLIKERIIHFFNHNYINMDRQKNPLFSVHDCLDPIVTVKENFDSLLVPKNHVSRSKSDCFYLNKYTMLRSHMTAHQSELIKMGFCNFIMVGNVFRRDDIDSTHYPVFHQLDAVRLYSSVELFAENNCGLSNSLIIEKAKGSRTKNKQEIYTIEATSKIETHLKLILEELIKEIFGPEAQFKWVEAYFPFTHPSWEMEIFFNGKWIEVLGCGVVEHKILENGGCSNKIGWAFGLGLERLAMLYYSIPDIRLFWTDDSGFHHQFERKTCFDKINFKTFSIYPSAPFDISFWVNDDFKVDNFYKIAKEICNDNIEHIELIDEYTCKKTQKKSYTFRLVYRSMEKTFTKNEVKNIHSLLEKKLVNDLNVEIR